MILSGTLERVDQRPNCTTEVCAWPCQSDSVDFAGKDTGGCRVIRAEVLRIVEIVSKFRLARRTDVVEDVALSRSGVYGMVEKALVAKPLSVWTWLVPLEAHCLTYPRLSFLDELVAFPVAALQRYPAAPSEGFSAIVSLITEQSSRELVTVPHVELLPVYLCIVTTTDVVPEKVTMRDWCVPRHVRRSLSRNWVAQRAALGHFRDAIRIRCIRHSSAN